MRKIMANVFQGIDYNDLLLFILIYISMNSYYVCYGQECIKPLFKCASSIESPYGVTAHFTLRWDYPTQNEQIRMLKDANVDNIRCDFWVPYPQQLSGNKLLSVIDNSTKISLDKKMNILAILFVGYRGQRPWQMAEQYWKETDYFIDSYAKKVKYWEVLNEVNLTADRDTVALDSVVASYMSLLPLTYQKLKKANPKIIVTSSGLGDINDDFLELLCKYQAYHYFDVLNFHSYDLPEDFPKKFRKIKTLMDDYNWNKPVWISECGMTTYVNPTLSSYSSSIYQREIEQAYRIARMHIIAFAYGVDKVYTYKFRAKEEKRDDPEDFYGIVHADLTPKPAYNAYKTLTKMLPSNSTRPTLITMKNNTYVSSWKRKDGKKVWALWNSNGETNLQLEIKGKANAYNYIGEQIALPDSGKFCIGKGVTYIVGGKKLSVNYRL